MITIFTESEGFIRQQGRERVDLKSRGELMFNYILSDFSSPEDQGGFACCLYQAETAKSQLIDVL